TTSGNGSDENLSGNSSNPATARNIKTDLESVPEIPDTGISKAKGLPTILQVIFVGITLAQQQRRQQRQQLVPHQRLRLPLRQQQRQQLRRQLQQQRPLRLQPPQQRQQLRRQLQQRRPLRLQPLQQRQQLRRQLQQQRPLPLQPKLYLRHYSERTHSM
ncbi:unnamed protein product, partial [Rotaria socialis]